MVLGGRGQAKSGHGQGQITYTSTNSTLSLSWTEPWQGLEEGKTQSPHTSKAKKRQHPPFNLAAAAASPWPIYRNGYAAPAIIKQQYVDGQHSYKR